MQDSIRQAASDLVGSSYAIVLTGAGMSTESGLADARACWEEMLGTAVTTCQDFRLQAWFADALGCQPRSLARLQEAGQPSQSMAHGSTWISTLVRCSLLSMSSSRWSHIACAWSTLASLGMTR